MWSRLRRPDAGLMQKLLLFLAVIVVFHQNGTQLYLLFCAGLGLIISWRQRKKKLDQLHRPAVLPKKLQLGLWLLLGVSYLSLHFVERLWACSFNYFYVVGQYLAVVWLLTRFGGPFAAEEEEPFPVRLLKVMAVMGLVVIGVGLVQNVLQVAPTDDWIDTEANPLLKTRVYSTWENPNILAGYLCMLGAYLMGFISALTTKKYRWYLSAYLLADLLCLIFTYSRGFWIAMACELAVFVACFYRRGWYYLAGAGALGAALAGPAFWQRLSTITSVHDTSAELRLAYLEIAANIIKDHPWGIGWYNYQFVFPDYDYFFKDPGVIMYHCHNLFLNITAELGFQGLFLFLAVVLFLARLAWNLHKQGRQPWLQALGRGYLLLLIGMGVSGLGDHVFFNVRLGVLFWLLSILVPIGTKYNEYC